MLFFSLGSFVQSAHLLDDTKSVRITRSTGRNNNATGGLTSEAIFHPVASSDSAEGSGHSVDSRTSQRLINKTGGLTAPKRGRNKNGSVARITLPTPALTLHHLQANDQEADEANTSVTGHTQSRQHPLPEEAFLESSHITTEQSHKSILDHDILGGK